MLITNWIKLIKLSTSILITLIVLSFAFEVYSLTVDYKERSAPLPDNYGNFDHVRALLNDDNKTEGFSFAVIGDIGSFGTFEKICAQLVNEQLSFVIILGDFVNKGTLEDHQFYRCELGEPDYFSCPVFYGVGNHEIDKGFKFTVSDFEKIYGPSNYSFSYKGDLFIILRTFPPHSTEETLAFLERELSTKRNMHDKVFVFSHIPLYQSPDFPTRSLKDSELYVSLLEEYHVDYAISADFHGYARVNVNKVNYVVTGGGGATLVNSNKYGNFHHALVVKVEENAVSERILAVEKQRDIEDKIEHFAIARVSPWVMQHKLATLSLNILGFLLLVLATYLRLKKYPNESVHELLRSGDLL